MEAFRELFGPEPTEEWCETNQLSFRPKIKCVRNAETPPLLFTVQEITRRVAELYGSYRCTLLEALMPDTQVKPFFDFELYFQEEVDDAERLRILEQRVLPPIQQTLKVDREGIRLASRHGWVARKGSRDFKVSFRAYVPGLRIAVIDMNALISDEAFSGEGWDTGIYCKNGEKMMGVVGGIKAVDGDVRVLRPLERGRPYHEYLIQALSGEERELQPAFSPAHTAMRQTALASVVRRDAKPFYLLGLSDDDMVAQAREALADNENRNFDMGAVRGSTVYVKTLPGQIRECMHGELHEENNASVLFMSNHSMVYHCYAKECKGEYTEIGTWKLKLPASMEDMRPGQLKEIDVAMVNALAESNDPDLQELAVEYLNRQVSVPRCLLCTAFSQTFLYF
jgi:hypothetical protein